MGATRDTVTSVMAHADSLLLGLLSRHELVAMRQEVELSEVVFGWDAPNRFSLRGANGQVIGSVMEDRGGVWGLIRRNILGTWASLTYAIFDSEGREIGRMSKGFSFFFHRIEVFEGERHFGSVTRAWSLLGRKYVLRAPDGTRLAQIRRPLFRLWTYPVVDMGGHEVARIGKKWGGVLREFFSDADTYAIQFTEQTLPVVRVLGLASMFLVDTTVTENNRGARGLLASGD